MPFNVRKADLKDAEGIAKVHVDTMRTTYQGIYPDTFLSSLSYDQARHEWESAYLSPESHDAVYVAEDNSNRVVGFVIYGRDRDNDPIYKGEVIGPYILKHVQRRGIGKRLMHAAVEDLKSRGFDSMIIWVLSNNPSKHFYEKLGGKHVQTRTISVGGDQFHEYGYGWKNVDSILAQKVKSGSDIHTH